MLDTALMQDLQRAMVPPASLRSAVAREWRSPLAERGEQMVGAFLDKAEADSREWRASLQDYNMRLFGSREPIWDEEVLSKIDSLIHDVEGRRKRLLSEADRYRGRRLKLKNSLAVRDPLAAKVLTSQIHRMDALQRANADALTDTIAVMRRFRNAVDTRSGAEPGFRYKGSTPNATTVAAMQEARRREDEAVTLDGLRTAILARD